MNVIALGFFDGVHIGHAALLKQAAEAAKRLGLTSCALKFDIQPRQLTSGTGDPLINTSTDREYLLKQHVEHVITLHFDDHLMHMSPHTFINDVIKPNAAHVVAGHDFRFGFKGEGTPEFLADECTKLGIGCDIIPCVELDGMTASSSLIRKLIAEGEMEKAVRFLGHAHILSGTVGYGKKIGTSIGSPTVNLEIPKNVVKPLYGVYLTCTFAKGQLFPSVTNIGTRPTVTQNDRPNAETTIFGFSGDLYGENIRVEFLKFMREEKKFESVEELRAQIQQDISNALDLHNHG